MYHNHQHITTKHKNNNTLDKMPLFSLLWINVDACLPWHFYMYHWMGNNLEILVLKTKCHHIHTFLAFLSFFKIAIVFYNIYIYISLKFSFPSIQFPIHLNMSSLHKPCNLIMVSRPRIKNFKPSLIDDVLMVNNCNYLVFPSMK